MKPATRACAFSALVGLGAALVVACARQATSDAGNTASSTVSSRPGPAATGEAALEGIPMNFSTTSPDGGPAMCGCKLCAPHISDDPCATDADCAPKTPCHATECVAVAHAAPRPSGMMCTQLFACNSVDANPCGCSQGKCALVPR